MAFPAPVPGMVIRYAYLWRNEHEQGREEGVKDRPCAILLAVVGEANERKVLVLPITHTPPQDPAHSVEIPSATKHRLGLDDARSWIVITEANRFTWPGPDLRPVHPKGGGMTIAYGQLPGDLYRVVRDRWLSLAVSRRSVVTRTI